MVLASHSLQVIASQVYHQIQIVRLYHQVLSSDVNIYTFYLQEVQFSQNIKQYLPLCIVNISKRINEANKQTKTKSSFYCPTISLQCLNILLPSVFLLKLFTNTFILSLVLFLNLNTNYLLIIYIFPHFRSQPLKCVT